MKYLNHLNAIIAVVGVLVIGNTLLQTFWEPGSPKRPTIGLTTGPRPVKSGASTNKSLTPAQGRRPSATAPVNPSPLGTTRVSPQVTPSAPTRITPGGVGQSGGFGIPGGGGNSAPAPATSGVIGQPGSTGRVMEWNNPPSGDPVMVEDPAGGKRVPPRRLNSRPGDTRSMYAPPQMNRGAKRDQQQTDPNAPAPPPRSSMPQ